VATGSGLLEITEIQSEGKRPMTAREFLAVTRCREANASSLHDRPARVAAYEILRAVSSGTDLPAAIASARGGLRDDRDRALTADIATGVQRNRAALDHVIAALSGRTLDRLDPEIVEILRLSAYQLIHHSRVPASAVVDDAVNLARRPGKRSATGFVNAVLRTISRRRKALPLPSRPEDPRTEPPRSITSASPCRIPAGSCPVGSTAWDSTSPSLARVQ
jgi:transcription termination factor NusB